jgi:hypothetical protein
MGHTLWEALVEVGDENIIDSLCQAQQSSPPISRYMQFNIK